MTHTEPPTDREETVSGFQSKAVPLENLVMKVTSVLAGIGVLVFVVVWLTQLRSDVNGMSRDISAIKLTIQSLNRVSELDAKIDELRRYGSDNARKNAQDIADLRKEFELHKATTLPNGTKP